MASLGATSAGVMPGTSVPTIATVFSLAKRPTGPDVVHVTVSARQWWWQYTYTDPNNGIVTADKSLDLTQRVIQQLKAGT